MLECQPSCSSLPFSSQSEGHSFQEGLGAQVSAAIYERRGTCQGGWGLSDKATLNFKSFGFDPLYCNLFLFH